MIDELIDFNGMPTRLGLLFSGELEKIVKYLDFARELKKLGIWRWQWYQLKDVFLEQSPKLWKKQLGETERRRFKLV